VNFSLNMNGRCSVTFNMAEGRGRVDQMSRPSNLADLPPTPPTTSPGMVTPHDDRTDLSQLSGFWVLECGPAVLECSRMSHDLRVFAVKSRILDSCQPPCSRSAKGSTPMSSFFSATPFIF